jgi:hypothetical protein
MLTVAPVAAPRVHGVEHGQIEVLRCRRDPA